MKTKAQTDEELLREDLQNRRLETIKTKLEGKGLDRKDILFLSSLFKAISDAILEDSEMEPRDHHVFCDEVATIMSNLSGEETYTKEDIQNLVIAFAKRPYKYVTTNDCDHFAGFRATDYFVELIRKEIGIDF